MNKGKIVEINTACDICNCYIGAPGHQVCDVELVRKYYRPQIPPMCPKRYKPGPRFRQEVEQMVLNAIRANGRMRSHTLALHFNTTASEIGAMVRKHKAEGFYLIVDGHRGNGWGFRGGSPKVIRGSGGIAMFEKREANQGEQTQTEDE